MEYRNYRAAHGKIGGLLRGLVLRQEYKTVLISTVRIVCVEENMPNMRLVILVFQLDPLKDIDMVILLVHF